LGTVLGINQSCFRGVQERLLLGGLTEDDKRILDAIYLLCATDLSYGGVMLEAIES
jgi:hypothetical protein